MTAHYIDEKTADNLFFLMQPKNALVCEICVATGLRITDVLNIKTEKLKSQRLTIKEQKTGKSRRVYIKKALFTAMKRQAGAVFVFESPHDINKHLTRQAVWADLKKAASMLGIRENISPHSFRKLYAVKLMRRYRDVKRVQKIIGHDSLACTVMYATSDLYG